MLPQLVQVTTPGSGMQLGHRGVWSVHPVGGYGVVWLIKMEIGTGLKQSKGSLREGHRGSWPSESWKRIFLHIFWIQLRIEYTDNLKDIGKLLLSHSPAVLSWLVDTAKDDREPKDETLFLSLSLSFPFPFTNLIIFFIFSVGFGTGGICSS